MQARNGIGKGDVVTKVGLQQVAAAPQGSRTCVCANTYVSGVAHALPWYRLVGMAKTSSETHEKEEEPGCPQG